MPDVDKVRDIVDSFEFQKDDYLGAEEQLSKFAESYEKLSAEDAELLRSNFDAKDRLGWFRIASALFFKGFSEADTLRKDKLCKIFFALYSFDNLEFGYDSVMDVISVSDQMRSDIDLAKKNWDCFCELTSNDAAKRYLESKIFVT